MKSKVAYLLLTLALASLTGCASPPEPSAAEKQGDTYYKRASFHLALPHYERAASAEPENARVQARLAETKSALYSYRLQSSRDAFDAGSPEAGIDAYARAVHELGADYPEMDAFGEEVARRAEGAIQSAVSAEKFQRAFHLQTLAMTELPGEGANGKQELERIRTAWLDALERRAYQDEEQRLWGSAMLTWSRAAKLEPAEKYTRHRAEMLDKILTRDSFQVIMPQDTLAPDAAVIVRALQRARWPRGLKLELLEKRAARQGVSIATSYEPLRCRGGDSAIERQCDTIFELVMTPFDRRLAPKTIREQLGASGRSEQAIREELYLRGARLTTAQLEREFALYRDALIANAEKIPLKRARIDAEIKVILLDPDRASPDMVRRIEEVSGHQHALQLLLHEPGRSGESGS